MKSIGLSVFLVVLVFASGVAAGAAAARPNIVLIVADDLGFSDLGCYGGEIRTPNLDRLAAEGMRFTQFYNCGTGVLSRASLYTGLHPRQAANRPMSGLLRNNMATLAEMMRRAGYATALSGKWQLGAKAPDRPIDRGFAEFYGALDGLSDHFDPTRADPDFWGGRSRPFAHNERLITSFPGKFYSTDAFSDHAIEMIRRWSKSTQPFFLNLCYAAPHYPMQAPAPDIARYCGRYRDGYEPVREQRFRRQIESGLFDPASTKLAPASLDFAQDPDMIPWHRLKDPARERAEARMEVYAAMVDRLDQGVGRVLAALEDAGLAANTAVFFISDNGGSAAYPPHTGADPTIDRFLILNRDTSVGDGCGYEFVGPSWAWAQNAPFRRFKLWTHEGGICTPMIVRWPGVVAAGTITKRPGHVVDFMPTLLEMAGGDYPATIDGRVVPPMEGHSLTPILRGGGPKPRLLPLGWDLYGSRALRDGDWKIVWEAGIRTWELYDLATDRTETVDLANQHPGRVAAMAAEWARWAQRTQAPTK